MVAALNNVNMVSPINRLSPFARGLVGCWVCLPGLCSGSRLIDLCNPGPAGQHGTMSGGAAFSGGGVTFAAGTQRVNLPAQSSGGPLKPPLPVTMFAVCKSTSLAGINQIICTDQADASVYGCVMNIGTSGAVSTSYNAGGGAGAPNRRTKTSTSTVAVNNVYAIGGSIRGATDQSIYINGIDAGGTYSGTGGALAYSSAAGLIGNTTDNLTDFIGTIYAVGFWNRDFSDTFHRELANESRLNYPTLFNRTSDAEQSAVMLATAALRRKLGLHTGGGYGLGVLTGGRL